MKVNSQVTNCNSISKSINHRMHQLPSDPFSPWNSASVERQVDRADVQCGRGRLTAEGAPDQRSGQFCGPKGLV